MQAYVLYNSNLLEVFLIPVPIYSLILFSLWGVLGGGGYPYVNICLVPSTSIVDILAPILGHFAVLSLSVFSYTS